MPATATGRGAQVILDGSVQQAARGAAAATMEGNLLVVRNAQLAGTVADGSSPDGTTSTAGVARDALNNPTNAMILSWLPATATYANDAAAQAGGVAIGQLYRNGSVVMVRVS